jgi:hypothetical protein
MASDSRTSLEEPSYDYNRINLSSDRKNEICSQIADSSESLPMWNTTDRDPINRSGPNQSIPDSSDVATPMPKANPLDSAALGNGGAAGSAAAGTNGVDGALGAPLKNEGSGNPLSQVPTQTEAEGDGHLISKKGDRPGTLRRLTTRIKRTISSKS